MQLHMCMVAAPEVHCHSRTLPNACPPAWLTGRSLLLLQSRGSVRDGSGVHDTIVNQLLTKIDGVDALNNILLIGMTNRWGVYTTA
jgi:hypothetical protein